MAEQRTVTGKSEGQKAPAARMAGADEPAPQRRDEGLEGGRYVIDGQVVNAEGAPIKDEG